MVVPVNDNITAMYNSRANYQTSTPAQQKGQCSTCVSKTDKSATKKQKVGVAICSTLGLAASLMLLAKCNKKHSYTINPLKMFKGNIKDSYLMKADYKSKEVIAMGIGSILGGLAGGALFDDKKNMNAKVREGIVQIANISFPIVSVEALTYCGDMLSKKMLPEWLSSGNIVKKTAAKLPAALGAMTGLVIGMQVGNKCSNKFNEKVFHKKDNRPVVWKDFSAHLDDIAVASTFVAPDNILTKLVSRAIPAALFVPGYETGTKKEV